MKTDKEAAQEFARKNAPYSSLPYSSLEPDSDYYQHQHVYDALLEGFFAGCKHKEESRWIPVTERLPPLFSDKFGESDYVLGHEEFGNQSVVCWYNYHTKEWRVAHYKADSLPIKITHWMPLPTPPQTNK